MINNVPVVKGGGWGTKQALMEPSCSCHLLYIHNVGNHASTKIGGFVRLAYAVSRVILACVRCRKYYIEREQAAYCQRLPPAEFAYWGMG